MIGIILGIFCSSEKQVSSHCLNIFNDWKSHLNLPTVKRLFLFYELKLDALAHNILPLFLLTISAINLFLNSLKVLKHQKEIMLPPLSFFLPKEICTVLSVYDMISKLFIILVAFGNTQGL